jgi:hypothetical protein
MVSTFDPLVKVIIHDRLDHMDAKTSDAPLLNVAFNVRLPFKKLTCPPKTDPDFKLEIW